MTVTYDQVCNSAKSLCDLFEMDYENPSRPLPLLVNSLLAYACAYNYNADDVEVLKEYFKSGCKAN